MSDTDADAWASSIVSGGGTVTAAQDYATQNLCVGLKSDSVFAKLNFLWPLYTDSLSAALVIDIVTRLTATPVASPTYTSKAGIALNGSSQYFNLNTTGGTSQNSASFGFDALVNRAAADVVDMGSSDDIALVNLKWSDNKAYWAVNDANGDAGRAAPADTSGIWVYNRTTSGQADANQSGSLFANNGQTSSGVPSLSYLLGACRAIGLGGAVSYFAATTMGMAFIGDGLTGTDIANLTTRWTNYKADLLSGPPAGATPRWRMSVPGRAVARASRY